MNESKKSKARTTIREVWKKVDPWGPPQEPGAGPSTKILVVLLVAAIAVVAVFACSTYTEAKRLDEMSAAEVESFAARTAAKVEILVEVALQEEDLDVEDVRVAAGVLNGLANGVVGLSVTQAFEVEGYTGAVLALVAMEVDAEIERRGGYTSNGVLVERAQVVVGEIAGRLDALADEYESDLPPGDPGGIEDGG